MILARALPLPLTIKERECPGGGLKVAGSLPRRMLTRVFHGVSLRGTGKERLLTKSYYKQCLFAVTFLAVFVLFPVGASAHDLVFPAEKLKTMYPSAESFEQKNLYVSSKQREAIEAVLGETLPEEDLKPSIYLAVVRKSPEARPRKVAAMMFIDARGAEGKIELGVVVSGRGGVEAVFVFENNEAPGTFGKEFLGQFSGKTAGDDFSVGKDVQAFGANLKTAQAVAAGVRRGIVIINEMFRRR